MSAKTNNGATVNTTNVNEKEMVTMTATTKTKKDYTLEGTINATTWQEFKTVMKEAGINTGTKTYEQLVEEYKSLTVVEVGDNSADKYYPELQTEISATKVIINRTKGDYLIKNIVKASFVATKGDSKGKRILTMHKLFGIIRKAYATDNEKLEETFIKTVVNQLVSLKYICFKRYESGAIIFYPTEKAAKYVNK